MSGGLEVAAAAAGTAASGAAEVETARALLLALALGVASLLLLSVTMERGCVQSGVPEEANKEDDDVDEATATAAGAAPLLLLAAARRASRRAARCSIVSSVGARGSWVRGKELSGGSERGAGASRRSSSFAFVFRDQGLPAPAAIPSRARCARGTKRGLRARGRAVGLSAGA